MRFRATYAGLLTLVLLCFSFAAAACETRCELKGARPGCHKMLPEATLLNGEQPIAGMSEARMPGMVGAAAEAIVVSSPPICAQRACVQEPALLSNEDARSASLLPHRATEASFVVVSMPALVKLMQRSIRWSPHIQQISPVELHTTLRV